MDARPWMGGTVVIEYVRRREDRWFESRLGVRLIYSNAAVGTIS
jgi:hypothetical protein